MELKAFLKSMTSVSEREAFAARCDTTIGHLNNVASGFRPCSTELAVLIEQQSLGAVTRPEVCPENWRKRWPELDAAIDQRAGQGA